MLSELEKKEEANVKVFAESENATNILLKNSQAGMSKKKWAGDGFTIPKIWQNLVLERKKSICFSS